MIIVDSREPPSFKAIGDKVEFLQHGDFIIDTGDQHMVFERKTYTDLFNSLKTGRLDEQLSHSDVLIVDTKFQYRKLNITRIQMIINTIAMKMPVLYIATPRILKTTLKGIEKKMREGTLTTTELRKPTFTDTYKDPRIAVLTALPHIGVKKAIVILQEYGNIASFMADMSTIDIERCNDKRYIRSLRISNLQGFGIKIVVDLIKFLYAQSL